jgi:TPR repeat protein/Tfp pilus assembly protein PilF
MKIKGLLFGLLISFFFISSSSAQGVKSEGQKEAIQIEPDIHDAHLNLGIAFEKSGKYLKAIAAYQEALTIKPDSASAQNHLTNLKQKLADERTLEEKKIIEGTLVEAQKRIQTNPDDYISQLKLGVTYLGMGLKLAAIDPLKEVIRINPSDRILADAQLVLGIAYKELGQHQNAIASMKEVIQINPSSRHVAYAHFHLSTIYQNIDGYTRTVSNKSQYHNNEALQLLLPDDSINEGDPANSQLKEAILLLERPLKDNPDSRVLTYAHYYLGVGWIKQFFLVANVYGNKNFYKGFEKFEEAIKFQDPMRHSEDKELPESNYTLTLDYLNWISNRNYSGINEFQNQGHLKSNQTTEFGDASNAVAVKREEQEKYHIVDSPGDPCLVKLKGEGWQEQSNSSQEQDDFTSGTPDPLATAIESSPLVQGLVGLFDKIESMLPKADMGEETYAGDSQQNSMVEDEESVQQIPDDANAHFLRANCYKNLNINRQAIAAYKEVIRLDPNYPDAHYYLGLTHQNMGDINLAKLFYNKALKVNPNDTATRDQLSELANESAANSKSEENIISNDALKKKRLAELGRPLEEMDAEFEKAEKIFNAAADEVQSLNPNGAFAPLSDSLVKARLARDFVTVKGIVTPLAENGHANSQYILSRIYVGALGVSQNMKEGPRLLRLAAEGGQVKAQMLLAFSYKMGVENPEANITKDLTESFKWYRLAAEQGNAAAQHHVGVMYAEGEGVAKDLKKSMKWIQRSAKQGDEDAKKSVAALKTRGMFLERVPLEADDIADSYSEEVKRSLETLQSTGMCVGCLLVGVDMSSKDLSHNELTKADLSKAILKKTYLLSAKLDDANLKEADLTGANLTGADLTGANLTGANLTGANLTNANFTSAELSGGNLSLSRGKATFEGANLTGANLSGANLRGSMINANLTGANLTGANLKNADLSGVNLTEANLTNATLPKLDNETGGKDPGQEN